MNLKISICLTYAFFLRVRLEDHYHSESGINPLMWLLARKQTCIFPKINYCFKILMFATISNAHNYLYHIHTHPALSTFYNILHLARRWQTRPSIRSWGCRQRERQLKQDQLHHTVFFSAKPGCPAFNTLPLGHAR